MGFYSDDKSKIHVKESNAPVSTGGRGRESITPKSVTFEALDHDMHRSSLTPNVALRCDIPASPDKFFVKGNVYYTASDSVFQSLSPFRHGRMLCKIVKELEHVPPTLMKYNEWWSRPRRHAGVCQSSVHLFVNETRSRFHDCS